MVKSVTIIIMVKYLTIVEKGSIWLYTYIIIVCMVKSVTIVSMVKYITIVYRGKLVTIKPFL